MKRTTRLLLSGLAMACACAAFAEDKPPATTTTATPPPEAAKPSEVAKAVEGKSDEPPVGSFEHFWKSKLPDVIAKGKFNLNVRLRYEYADQGVIPPGGVNLKESDAFTIRTRFGYTTAPLYGFQGMIEGENVSVIGPRDNFNAAGSNPGAADKTIVADPATTELNQAWLSYSNWNSTIKAGRQRIAFDNHRFIGDVGWRQNQQTFDAVTFETKPFKDFTATYGYIWWVNRVFGDVPGLAAASPNRDFDSDSHVINMSYAGLPFGKITGYAYLLDLRNGAAATLLNSSATYGLSFVGGHTFDKEMNAKINYRAEYAYQTDYADNPVKYSANYLNLEGGGEVKMFNFGAGYELLGSDHGTIGFRTPLATLHAFNGWADMFLTTPAAGLRDVYVWAGVKLPYDVPLKVIYHKYDSDTGSLDYGDEWDAVISHQFGKNWSAMLKYAHYNGVTTFADMDKFWAQIEFNF